MDTQKQHITFKNVMFTMSKHSYRKISNTIRTIFTKNRGLEAGVRIIHLN